MVAHDPKDAPQAPGPPHDSIHHGRPQMQSAEPHPHRREHPRRASKPPGLSANTPMARTHALARRDMFDPVGVVSFIDRTAGAGEHAYRLVTRIPIAGQ